MNQSFINSKNFIAPAQEEQEKEDEELYEEGDIRNCFKARGRLLDFFLLFSCYLFYLVCYLPSYSFRLLAINLNNFINSSYPATLLIKKAF